LERTREALAPARAKKSPGEQLMASVETHLRSLLNARQGTSKSGPDFGMPDYQSLLSLGDRDGIRELARVLAEVIRKYEPRLAQATVSYVPGSAENGVLEFSLGGVLTIGESRQNVFFQTSITPDGAVTVRK
jgi:type VI secretion system protein